MEAFLQLIEEEIATGKVILPKEKATPTEERIDKAVAEEMNTIYSG